MEAERALPQSGDTAEARRRRLARVVPGVLRDLRAAAEAARGARDAAAPEAADEADDGDANALCLRRPWLRRRDGARETAPRGPPAAVEPWQVPVLLARPKDLLSLSGPAGRASSHFVGDDAWDLAVQQVIPHVDGVRDAKQVARAAHVDVDVVARSLRVPRRARLASSTRLQRERARRSRRERFEHSTRTLESSENQPKRPSESISKVWSQVLRHYGCLAVVDTFQYANVYRCTAAVAALARSPDAADACAAFALRGAYEDAPGDAPRRDRGRRPPDRRGAARAQAGRGRGPEAAGTRLLRLFCAFRDGKTVRDVLLDAARAHPALVDALDHRALVAFGVVHGVLRRVHRWPTAVGFDARGAPPGDVAARAAALMDGTRCMDDVCSELDVPAARLDAVLARRGVATVDVFK